jgi:hypothetical protein
MRSAGIVPLDPLPDRCFRIGEVLKLMLQDTLLLQAAEEPHSGVYGSYTLASADSSDKLPETTGSGRSACCRFEPLAFHLQIARPVYYPLVENRCFISERLLYFQNVVGAGCIVGGIHENQYLWFGLRGHYNRHLLG